MPPRVALEVAVETAADAHAAAKAGADRVELSSALDLGGLTPSVGLLEETLAACPVPVWVMVRPRGGDFVYTDDELRVMVRDAQIIAERKPAGIVFGALDDDGRINVDACRKVLDAAGGLPAVFHRAFDRCPDPAAAMEILIALGVARILTSGREPTALAGAANLKVLMQLANGRIEILPCGKIRAGNVETVLDLTGCDQIHASFGEPVAAGKTRGRRGYPTQSRVSFEGVQETRALLDRRAR